MPTFSPTNHYSSVRQQQVTHINYVLGLCNVPQGAPTDLPIIGMVPDIKKMLTLPRGGGTLTYFILGCSTEVRTPYPFTY